MHPHEYLAQKLDELFPVTKAQFRSVSRHAFVADVECVELLDEDGVCRGQSGPVRLCCDWFQGEPYVQWVDVMDPVASLARGRPVYMSPRTSCSRAITEMVARYFNKHPEELRALADAADEKRREQR